MTEPIKINGGAYKWYDSKDGYKIVLDVPLVAAFTKGTKGIEYEGDKATLEQYVEHGQNRYGDGFCATAYKGHNQEIPITHPDFVGYVLPTRVGTARTDKGDVTSVFGNIKITDGKFEEAKAGKLPYLSPEISRFQKKIRGVAFLDTIPPHNEFPLFTIGEEAKDSVAAFAAEPDTANFSDAPPAKSFERDYPEAHSILRGISENMAKLMAKLQSTAIDPLTQKPDPLPAEPGMKEAKMAMDPELAAKFSALTAENAENRTRLDKMENDQKAARFAAKAEAGLGGKIVPAALKDQIAQFAGEWAALKDGEQKLDRYIEVLKPSLKDKPTTDASMSAQMAADAGDETVARLAKEGGDPNELAQFAASYAEQVKLSGGRLSCPKEQFIRNEMRIAASRRNGTFSDSRR